MIPTTGKRRPRRKSGTSACDLSSRERVLVALDMRLDG